MNYTIKTWVDDAGKVWQEILDPMNGVIRQVADISAMVFDAAIRKELIRHGWTPPQQEGSAS